LSRVEAIQEAIDFEALATSQKEDEEMRQYKTGKLGLKLKKIPILESAQQLYCDTTIQNARSYVTQPFRRQAFQALHNLAHLEVKVTAKLVTERYVWPNIRKDVTT